jgi:hypothetical protein
MVKNATRSELTELRLVSVVVAADHQCLAVLLGDRDHAGDNRQEEQVVGLCVRRTTDLTLLAGLCKGGARWASLIRQPRPLRPSWRSAVFARSFFHSIAMNRSRQHDCDELAGRGACVKTCFQ